MKAYNGSCKDNGQKEGIFQYHNRNQTLFILEWKLLGYAKFFRPPYPLYSAAIVDTIPGPSKKGSEEIKDILESLLKESVRCEPRYTNIWEETQTCSVVVGNVCWKKETWMELAHHIQLQVATRYFGERVERKKQSLLQYKRKIHSLCTWSSIIVGRRSPDGINCSHGCNCRFVFFERSHWELIIQNDQ